MPQFGLSQRTTNGTAAAAAWEVRSGSTMKPRVFELGFSNVAATASVFGIGRPAAIGITPTSPQTFVDESDGNAGTSTVTAAVAWGTGPTVPANFNRRIALAAAIGAGTIFTFPRGFGLPVSGSVVLWVIATASVVDAYASEDE